MTPAERQLVTELFDRLATLEDAPRDAEAERMIRDGLAQAPNALYALVQTALVQDEALRQANDRIQQLEAELGAGREPQRQGGFLDSVRGSIFGREPQRGSVPSVRPGDAPMGAPAGFGAGQPIGTPAGYGAGAPMPQPPMQQPPQAGGRGGSFLGTAAAAAAGVIGGSLLLDGIRSMTGSKPGGFGFADPAAAAGRDGGSPWGRDSGGGFGGGSGFGSGGGFGGGGSDDLARQLGADQIGRGGGAPFEQPQGLFGDRAEGGQPADPFDQAADHSDVNYEDDGSFDDGGGGFGGDE